MSPGVCQMKKKHNALYNICIYVSNTMDIIRFIYKTDVDIQAWIYI